LNSKPNILVCPLDWGIGHATRCVPIIKELLNQDVNVLIGASGRSQAFLKTEFPDLTHIGFTSYRISYSRSQKGLVLKMVLQIPSLLKSIRREHKILEDIIIQYKIDGVISDNRYGLYSNKVPSVFMTHQVFIKTPPRLNFLQPILLKINKRYISKYKECWIPDLSGKPNLSGELSHKKGLPERYYFIGPLSRFSKEEKTDGYKLKVLVILSGPEPQRSIFEERIIKELKDLEFTSAMVCGKPEEEIKKTKTGNCDVYPHLSSSKLLGLIQNSEIVITRSGYSTIMDLAVLGKKAILIPTPGQTEQEYLGQYFSDQGIFPSFSQKEFTITKALDVIPNFTGQHIPYNNSILKSRITQFLKMI